MNLTTLNANEGWPIQTHFYYNNKQLNADHFDMFANDHLSKEGHFELVNSPTGYHECYPTEPMTDALYEQNYPIVEHQSHEYNFPERIPRHFDTSGNFENEPNFFAVDTSNSNCPLGGRNASFVTNYSHFPVSSFSHHSLNSSNEAFGEKKFISELHINIKEPNPDEYAARPSFTHEKPFVSEYGNYPPPRGYHLSSFETYVDSQNNEMDVLAKTNYALPDNRPSSDSPNRKRECHHSEKFIYLGRNSQVTPQLSEINNDASSSHSANVYEVPSQRPAMIRSRDFELDELKSFSTKSVQTTNKVDCLFKNTCDRCVETDFAPEPKEDKNKTRRNVHLPTMPVKQSSDSESENPNESTDNLSEMKLQNFQCKPDITKNLKCSPGHQNILKPFSKDTVKNVNLPMDDTNQDTYAGSYSETFSHSNEICESPVRDKPDPVEDYREIPTKKTSKLTETKTAYMKKNITNINNKLAPRTQPKKGFSDRKDLLKFTDRSSYINDLKQVHVSKEDTDRHSLEIQCLLDNLNTHLQNTVNSQNKPSKNTITKSQNNQFSNIGSFWDNPLNPETTRSLFMTKQITPKNPELIRQKAVNPEIQAIFETLEKSHNLEKIENQRMNQKQSSNIDLNMRKQKIHNMGDNYPMKMCGDGLGSTDNLQDSRFPSNLKFQKSFELSPYDELVKSHLNASDRRIKSVAAKNGCRIVIDGPISLIDTTTTCQAIRNKIAYRCAVAGPSKDRLDKCLNYLKETFPNTCLRLHSRSNLAIQN